MSFFDDYVEGGLCCEGCGMFMGGSEPGYVRYCAGCAKADDRHAPRVPPFRQSNIKPSPIRADQVACPDCGKRVKKVGLRHHQLDKHPAASSPDARPVHAVEAAHEPTAGPGA